jgi:guanylate kinase
MSDVENIFQTRMSPLLFIFSGPSGAGKDSIVTGVQKAAGNVDIVVTTVDRSMRPGESEGHPYYFVTTTTFEKMIQEHTFIEYARVHRRQWMGLTYQSIRDSIARNKDMLLQTTVDGAMTIRQKIMDAVYIFILPASLEDLALRRTGRGTENAAEMRQRSEDAYYEIGQQHLYDYRVINETGHLQRTVDQVIAIMMAEHCKINHRHLEVKDN